MFMRTQRIDLSMAFEAGRIIAVFLHQFLIVLTPTVSALMGSRQVGESWVESRVGFPEPKPPEARVESHAIRGCREYAHG